MKAFFVTGTDTGVGKTTVACALLAAARARGLRALAMKPVETGCTRDADGALWPADALALERAIRGDDITRTIHIVTAPPSEESAARDRDSTPFERHASDSTPADRARSNQPRDDSWPNRDGELGDRAGQRRSDPTTFERDVSDAPPADHARSSPPRDDSWPNRGGELGDARGAPRHGDPAPFERQAMDSPPADLARSNRPGDWPDASESLGARMGRRRGDSRPIEGAALDCRPIEGDRPDSRAIGRLTPDSTPADRAPSNRPGHIDWLRAREPSGVRADGPTDAWGADLVPDRPPAGLDDHPAGQGARSIPLSNVYRFAAPLAPSVAAELERMTIALAPILRAADRLRSLAPDFFLVEGAGGLMVPLTDSLDMADLAAALAMPLVVVARDGLGTINHTLLTLAVAAARGLTVAAVVLSASTSETSDTDAARNAREIERRSGVPVVGRLPHLLDPSSAALIAAAEAHLDLSLLLGPRTTI